MEEEAKNILKALAKTEIIDILDESLKRKYSKEENALMILDYLICINEQISVDIKYFVTKMVSSHNSHQRSTIFDLIKAVFDDVTELSFDFIGFMNNSKGIVPKKPSNNDLKDLYVLDECKMEIYKSSNQQSIFNLSNDKQMYLLDDKLYDVYDDSLKYKNFVIIECQMGRSFIREYFKIKRSITTFEFHSSDKKIVFSMDFPNSNVLEENIQKAVTKAVYSIEKTNTVVALKRNNDTCFDFAFKDMVIFYFIDSNMIIKKNEYSCEVSSRCKETDIQKKAKLDFYEVNEENAIPGTRIFQIYNKKYQKSYKKYSVKIGKDIVFQFYAKDKDDLETIKNTLGIRTKDNNLVFEVASLPHKLEIYSLDIKK